jgi:hypothetical protein
MSMTEVAQDLHPNADDIAQHLKHLFGNAGEYDDGMIEIAVNTGKGWLGQIYRTDEIEAATAYAVDKNQQRCNVYVGVALRDPDLPPFGRASDSDHYATTAVAGDLDTAESSAAAPARTKALPPSFIVCTGTHPHARLQPYWVLREAITDQEQHRAAFGGIADSLEGDRAITNPSRVMRLAGTIAWPTKPGRVPELTSLVPLKYKPRAYDLEEVMRAYPASAKVHSIDTARKNDPIERVATGALGLGAEQISDGREAYMRDTILAVLIQWIGENGSVPTDQELYDAAWPQYSAHVDFSRPGRGPDEMVRKIRSTLGRFERGQLRGLPDMDAAVARWREKQKAERPRTTPPADYTAHLEREQEHPVKQQPDELVQKSGIKASPFRLVPEDQIPPRDWVYGRHLIRRFVSATVAPGGVGKSSLTFVEAMAMVTGKPLLGVNVAKPLKVWVWCLEDPREELDRRFAAIAKHYKIADEDIGERLFLNSGRDTPLCVARQETKTGAIIVEPDMGEIEREITALGIDVLLVDPFVASHQVSENDNVAINAVMRQWVLLAERCNVAIELIHHTRKNGDGEVTAETSRGAKALTDATRDTRVINQMSEAEAAKFGVENRRLHFRTYSDKANLAPPAEHSDWYMLENVALANGVMGADGDHVGVATRWEVPGPFHKVSKDTINSILQAIDLGVIDDDGKQTGIPYGESSRGGSKRWVGQVLMDHGMEEEEAKRAVAAWISSGVLTIEKVEVRRREATAVKVNKTAWAEIVGASNG